MGQEDKEQRGYRPRAPGKEKLRRFDDNREPRALKDITMEKEKTRPTGKAERAAIIEQRRKGEQDTPTITPQEVTPVTNKRAAETSLSVSNLRDKKQAKPTNTALAARLRTDIMEIDDGEPEQQGFMALGAPDGGTSGSLGRMQRVQVIPRQPELLPWTEQRTACLPLTMYFSLNMMDHKAPVVMKIRLNNHYDILKNSTLTAQTVNTGRSKGLSNDFALTLPFHTDTTGIQNGSELIPFPCTVRGSTASTATTSSFGTHNASELRPAGRTYYDRVWKAYANYKTEYKITVLNAAGSMHDLEHVTLLSKLERYTTSTGSDRLIPQDAPLNEARKWGLTEHRIEPRNVNTQTSDYTIIDGVWTPTKPQQLNVFNDEDIKVWQVAGNECAGGHVDDLTILGYKHDMFPVAPRVIRSHETEETYSHADNTQTSYTKQWVKTSKPCINIRVDLKYYVVYKDLVRAIRYPKYTDNDECMLAIHDQYQKPRTPEYVPNTSPNNTL